MPVSRLMIETETTIRIIKRKITTEAATTTTTLTTTTATTITRTILHFQIYPPICLPNSDINEDAAVSKQYRDI